MNRDKIHGVFFGVAIGDALGMPVETWPAQRIKDRYGYITQYYPAPDDHPFLKDYPAGKWTDDTQLTLAVAESMIRSGGINMDDMARMHVQALHETESGWGGSTTDAVRRLEQGMHWSESGKAKKKNRGKGNGVAMKVAPLLLAIDEQLDEQFRVISSPEEAPSLFDEVCNKIKLFGAMTHNSIMGVASGVTHATMVCCMTTDGMSQYRFAEDFAMLVSFGTNFVGEDVVAESEDRLMDRLKLLETVTEDMSDDEIRKKFGNGSCYVYESLPVAYALFLRKKGCVGAIYDAVNFGGDTDTVASIVGSLVGAYRGMSVFPQKLIDGLWHKEYILDVANRFYDTFSIKE